MRGNEAKLIDVARGELNYTAIAIYALRRIPLELRMQLQRNGRWDDILSACQLAAVESFAMNDATFACAYNRAQRNIYAALKAEGYRRQSKRHGTAMEYQRHEIPVGLVRQQDLLELLEYTP